VFFFPETAKIRKFKSKVKMFLLLNPSSSIIIIFILQHILQTHLLLNKNKNHINTNKMMMNFLFPQFINLNIHSTNPKIKLVSKSFIKTTTIQQILILTKPLIHKSKVKDQNKYKLQNQLQATT
jgi:hypothetical protein